MQSCLNKAADSGSGGNVSRAGQSKDMQQPRGQERRNGRGSSVVCEGLYEKSQPVIGWHGNSSTRGIGAGVGCLFRLGLAAALLLCPLRVLRAQDLAPRAYVITPLHFNAVTLTWSFYDGSINQWRAPSQRCKGEIQRTYLQLLSLIRPLWPLGQHRRRGALRSRKLPRNCVGSGTAPLPLRSMWIRSIAFR